MKTVRTYIRGFVFSVALTLAAFGLVFWYLEGTSALSREVLIVLLVALAVAQLFVQLFCFLHLGAEEKPRWNAITLAFAAFVVLVLVGGTMWIMYHLDRGHADLSEVYRGGVISPQTQDD